MGLYKELYIDVLEEMIGDFLEKNPGVTWEQAYNMLSDDAYDAAMDRYAERADQFKDKSKAY